LELFHTYNIIQPRSLSKKTSASLKLCNLLVLGGSLHVYSKAVSQMYVSQKTILKDIIFKAGIIMYSPEIFYHSNYTEKKLLGCHCSLQKEGGGGG